MTGRQKKIGRIHVITDTTVQHRFDHVQLARLAIRGGADTVQLRDKSLSPAGFLRVAAAVLEVCREGGVPLIINDRTDVAGRIGADGVHLGREDTPITEARRRLGDNAVIGGSAGSLEQAVEAANAGADYVGFGHVFPTRSKQKPGPAVGPESLRRVCRAVSVPVIGIGGITPEGARAVIGAGAWGVAVIGAVCAADDPEAATRRLVDAVGGFHEEQES